MPLQYGLGLDTYVAYGRQSTHGTSVTPGNVQPIRHEASVLKPRNYLMPLMSNANIMPRSKQVWGAPKMVDWQMNLEYSIGFSSPDENNLHMLADLMLAFFGKYVKSGVAPTVLRTFSLQNPPIQDSGEQADSATDFYGRPLSLVWGVRGVRQMQCYDAAPTDLALIMEGGQPFRVEASGIGAVFSDAAVGTPAFADFARPIMTWSQALDNGATSYLRAQASATPTDKIEARRVAIRFGTGLRFDPQVGIPVLSAYKKPYRNGPPTIRVEMDLDFDYARSGYFDASEALAAFTAGTREAVDIKWSDGANSAIVFTAKNASAALNPGLIEDLSVNYQGDGVLGLTLAINILPDAVADLTFTITSSS